MPSIVLSFTSINKNDRQIRIKDDTHLFSDFASIFSQPPEMWELYPQVPKAHKTRKS